jgi:hypothetical protein
MQKFIFPSLVVFSCFCTRPPTHFQLTTIATLALDTPATTKTTTCQTHGSLFAHTRRGRSCFTTSHEEDAMPWTVRMLRRPQERGRQLQTALYDDLIRQLHHRRHTLTLPSCNANSTHVSQHHREPRTRNKTYVEAAYAESLPLKKPILSHHSPLSSTPWSNGINEIKSRSLRRSQSHMHI